MHYARTLRPAKKISAFFLHLLLPLLLGLLLAACDSGGGGGSGGPEPESGYTLRGTVSAAANSAADSDVNDRNAPYASNNDKDKAQMLYPPFTLGGYVNEYGAGPEGRSYPVGDTGDYFVADLEGDERIVLNMAAPVSSADLDLYLFDSGSEEAEPIDSAMEGDSRTEALEIQGPGRYWILVAAYRGASNYTLTVGPSQGGQQLSALRLSRDFVPGEAIVAFTENSRLSAGATAAAADSGIEQMAGGPGRAGLYRIGQATSADFRIQSQKSADWPDLLPKAAAMDETTRAKLETLYAIKGLKARADVAAAEPNDILQAFQTPNDTYYGSQWHYPLINLPEAWDNTDLSTSGTQGVTVAVLDTGVIMDHPDLAANISSDGYDFVSSIEQALDGNGIDVDPDDPGDQSQGGSSFHGTHVAGTIAAVTNNEKGTAGASWNSRILPVRVLGKDSSGTSYDILQGVRYAAGLANDSGIIPDQPADIINLSFGGSFFSEAAQNVYTQARNNGVILISAAGNAGDDAPSYPAAYDGVISTSAVNINAAIAPYSNFGSSIDVAAPGGDFTTNDLNSDGYADGILSTCGDDSSGSVEPVYSILQGTSMASAHFAGVAALMEANQTNLTPDKLDQWIRSGYITRDLGPAGRDDYYGYGLIDAGGAAIAARDLSPPTVLTVSPNTLNLGTSINTATLTAAKLGNDSLTVTDVSITGTATWLNISASDTDSSGLGNYTVTVDRESLSEGSYETTAAFVSSENTVNVPVQIRIYRNGGITPNAGLQYILLVDTETDETVDQAAVAAQNGSYAYQFQNVEDGSYRIYAGSDMNNDGIVGDAGESFGAYMSTDQPALIEIAGDRAGLDFVTEFNVRISAGKTALQSLSRLDKPDSGLKQLEEEVK